MAHKHLDPEVLKSLREIMGGDYPYLLQTFLDDTYKREREIREARDSLALNAAAHSFKGSCANMGALHLAELCRQLEVRASTEPFAHSAALVTAIEAECSVVRQLYQQQLARYHPHPL